MRTTALLSALALVFAIGCDRTGDGGGGGGAGTGGAATGTGGTGTGGTATATATGTGTGTGTGGGGGGNRDCSEGPSNPDYLWDDEFAYLYPSTTESYAVDAGVAAVVAAAEALAEGEDVSGLGLQVTDAVVTNIGYMPDGASDISFWFGDANGYMRTYRTVIDPALPNDVKRGDTVSFVVDAITNYAGEYEVTAITGFTVTGSGQPIQMLDANELELDYPTHGRMNVSVYGEVIAVSGECGSSICYDYELWNGQVVNLRVSDIVEIFEGDCIWWAGPLGNFDGLQLDANNFDWFAFY